VKTRILAGVVGLSVLLPALFLGGVMAVQVVALLALVVCADEFATMAFPEDLSVARAWLILSAATLHSAAVYGDGSALTWVLPVVVVLTMAFVMLRPGQDLERAADSVGRYLVGQVWIGLFLASLVWLRRLDHGLGWVFVVLAVSWCGDTFAYFAGRAFGKHKLYERVSPKKTWEGFFGGLVGGVVGLFLVRWVGMSWSDWSGLTPVDCVLLGVTLGAAAVAGDLSESLMKRAFKVKDSGWIMPGHGGLLDRIDSVLFVAPLLVGYVIVFKGLG
jgi:phosphatidate cytidylyltransferase